MKNYIIRLSNGKEYKTLSKTAVNAKNSVLLWANNPKLVVDNVTELSDG